jgi:hypothetical protein
MATLTDRIVRHWHLQAQPLLEQETALQDKLDLLPAQADEDTGLFSIFNGFGDPESRQALTSRLASVRGHKLELAQAFTLRVIKQASGSDGRFDKRYRAYQDKRKAECSSWPMTMSPGEARTDYLSKYFLLQYIKLPADQENVIDQMLDFYQYDDSLPASYRPEKDPEHWINKL